MSFNPKSYIKYLLYLYIISKFVYPFLVRYFHFPALPSLMLEIAFIIFFMIINAYSIITNKRDYSPKYLAIYKLFFTILLLLFLASAVINNNNWFLVFKSSLAFFFPFILVTLVIIKSDFTEKEQLNLLKFVFFLIVLQIPVTLFQYIVFHPLTADSNNGTLSYGPLGGTGIIAVLESFLLAYCIANLLYKGFNLKYVVIAGLTFIPPVVGGARFGFIASPVALILTLLTFLYLYKKVAPSVIIKMTVIGILFLSVLAITIIFIIPHTRYTRFLNFDVILNSKKAEQYDDSDKGAGRFVAYPILFDQYFTNDVNTALGFGPGSVVESKTAGTSQAALNFVVNLPDAVVVLASLGIAGIAFMFVILLFPVIFIKEYVNLEQNIEMHIYASIFVPMSVITCMALFYCPTWNTQIGLVYFITLAVFLSRYKVFAAAKNLHIGNAGLNKISLSKAEADSC